MRISRHVVWGAVLVALGVLTVLGYWALLFPRSRSMTQVDIPAERVAEYVHAIIQANRTVYATNVVERMQGKKIVQAAEHWKQDEALPLPDQFVMDSGRVAAQQGITYRLAGLAPINEKNRPATPFERKGLEAVSRDPARPYVGVVSRDHKNYFTAIYADAATAQDCVVCHNRHPSSHKRDYKLGDVLGGVIITIPLEE